MASAREHMAQNHGQEQAHWSEFAKGLGELGAHVRAMHKEAGMAGESKLADTCDKLSGLAQAHSNYHGEQFEACQKAVESALDKLVPMNVSGIAPERPGLRAIPRFGQPAAQAQPTCDPQLEKIFGLRDEDQDSEEASLRR